MDHSVELHHLVFQVLSTYNAFNVIDLPILTVLSTYNAFNVIDLPILTTLQIGSGSFGIATSFSISSINHYTTYLLW